MAGVDFNWAGLALAILAASPLAAWVSWLWRPRHHAEAE
jgi:hypothetical protein